MPSLLQHELLTVKFTENFRRRFRMRVLLYDYLLWRERGGVCEQRERMPGRLPAEGRADHGARSQDPEVWTGAEIESQMLK